jgi:hypothetical protein
MRGDRYYHLSVDILFGGREPMLLGCMPDLPEDNEDDWSFGQPFSVEPEEPIHVSIREGHEGYEPLHFYTEPTLASQAFVDALLEAGVDNLVTYDVVLRSRTDPTFTIGGYKALNIIGLVGSVGPGGVYLADLMGDWRKDASEHDPMLVKRLYLFRRRGNFALVVHQRLKDHLQAKGFDDLEFTELSDALAFR